ncbi:helix-turn-helix domain-containing protein [Halocatena pleomorpha]|uniref:Bacterio-opsin activator n=1 Tax=Halocatena pleomorpha TaxID=1785090 RepID=A0A3P3RHZ4_9EURY|nr:helix-turn-helix domain-containing protein [Halocatena pleomorpha]RRJ32489.1 bacterio-opsin activator [Halocatena pleomorpha]
MIVVEVRMESPILQESLAHAPEMIINYEEMYQTGNEILFLFWTTEGDLAAFEDGLDADPTVANPTQLAETQTRRLYRVTFTKYGKSVATYPAWPELDMSLLDATTATTHGGWILRIQMSNRETLQQFQEICAENGIDIFLKTVHKVRENTTEADTQLTSSQREALLTARELGYFQVPRRVPLATVADHCGISSQALSERLRRGTATVIDTAL